MDFSPKRKKNSVMTDPFTSPVIRRWFPANHQAASARSIPPSHFLLAHGMLARRTFGTMHLPLTRLILIPHDL